MAPVVRPQPVRLLDCDIDTLTQAEALRWCLETAHGSARARILLTAKPKIPLLNRFSDEIYFKVIRRLSKALAPYLDAAARQDGPLPRESLK